MRKIYRLKSDALIAGVCAGIADSFCVNPIKIRLGLVFLTVLTGWLPGIITYLAAWFLLYDKKDLDKKNENKAGV
ncbi:MAG TPA: PspC domain-containing protein [Chitinispirillaceae bacterium]|nr:PspC domain-containing protein [Chitinispirillaceae bacterium]